MKTENDHYYTEDPKSKFILYKIDVLIKNEPFSFYSATGIFSKKKLDNGSRLLLENAQIKNNAKILDIGCGSGVIGIYLAEKNPSCKIIMSDINKRAVEIVKKNIILYSLKNATAVHSDLYSSIKDKFDIILSNPPQAAGKKVCLEIINGAYEHLNSKGMLQLVARKKKGGETLRKHMEETFGNARAIARGSGFQVYLSVRE